MCFLSRCRVHGDTFEAALFTPICVILFVNLVIFMLALYRLVSTKSIRREQGGKMVYSHRKTTLQRSMTFALLLGLTWIVGLVMLNEGTLSLQYVFTVLVSLQGFFLFVMQLTVPEVRHFWRRLLRRSSGDVELSLNLTNNRVSLCSSGSQVSETKAKSVTSTSTIITNASGVTADYVKNES